MNNEKIKLIIAQSAPFSLIKLWKDADFELLERSIQTLIDDEKRDAYMQGELQGRKSNDFLVENIQREAVENYIQWFNKTGKIHDSDNNWWSYKEYLSSQVKESK